MSRFTQTRLDVTPWFRRQLTDEDWAALHALVELGDVRGYASSARGPFTVRLGIGDKGFIGCGTTAREAISRATRHAAEETA